MAESLPLVTPQITKLDFVIYPTDRILQGSMYYEGVAGDVADAKLTLVIVVMQNLTEEIFYPIPLGKPNVLTRDTAHAKKDKITEGQMNFFLKIPEAVKFKDVRAISGFGMVIVDVLGRRSPPYFIEVEIVNQASI